MRVCENVREGEWGEREKERERVREIKLFLQATRGECCKMFKFEMVELQLAGIILHCFFYVRRNLLKKFFLRYNDI